ncbi:uncharacterized protein A1O9_02970, partial [Exophiala aquamarina CBS 119918]
MNMPGLVRKDSLSPYSHTMSAEAPPLSPADKKRNKLGYHRTAVACGHCRRRKIRCIPAFDDQSGRCQNCIRLKKDCHFFPVDQQSPAPGPKRTRKPTDGVQESETSVSSSPAGGVLRSNSFDQLDAGEGVMDTPPMGKGSPGFHYQHGQRSFSSHVGLQYHPQYDPSLQPQPQPEDLMASPYDSHSPRTLSSDATNAQYYQQYNHPLQGSYHAPFASASLPSTATGLAQGSGYPYPTGIPNGYQWGQHPAPSRSMSTGESEDLTHGFSHPYRTNTYPSFERRMTGEMQQIPSTNAGYVTMSIGSSSSTIPAQLREPSTYHPMHMGMQQDWSSGGQSGQMPGTTGSDYPSSWYPQQELTDLREEEDHPHLVSSRDHPLR